jgi:hypothetical protein
MLSNELIIDAFDRISQVVHKTISGLSIDDLTFRPNESANSIGWLVWHLTRIQDDHIAGLREESQVWTSEGWFDKFSLPFNESETGYGHTSDDVSKVRTSAKLLLDYYNAVAQVTKAYISGLKEDDYKKIVDRHWDPPVTLAIRLVSVISDDLQHAGQAAYIRGLIA